MTDQSHEPVADAPEVWALEGGDEYVVLGTASEEAARQAVIEHAQKVEGLRGEDLDYLIQDLSVSTAHYVMLDDERIRWVKGDEPGAVACFRGVI